MFTLVTGAPGSGKTSHVIARYRNVTDRPIYHRGIRDLKLPWVELSDDEAREWHKHVEDGAIVIIDECQDIFPQRPLSRPTPEGCSILSKHRHRGLDIVFITQAPTAVDHEARKYVNEHYHYSRSFGAAIVTEYHKGNGVIDLKDKWALKTDVNKRQVKLPKKVWGLYHSAEVHTHKFRIPTKLWIIPFLIAAVAFGGWYMWSWVDSAGQTDGPDQSEQPAEGVAPAATSARRVPSAASWSDLLRPDIPGVPYTAPLYDAVARQPRSVPVIHGCMAFETDQSDCRCYTQQGTRIRGMPVPVCRRALQDGVFNHMADPQRVAEQGDSARGRAQADARRPRAQNEETSL
ncbi:MAG: zonular occludens toxin domain-containing protein [Alcanivorax sp.]